MPDSTAGRRPLWKRLLRIATWSISTLLALCLLGYAILVAINWHDEPLTPETQAWLTEPANPVPDAQNAWLAMLALAYPQQSGPQAGRQILGRLRTAPVISEDATTYTKLDAKMQQEFGPLQAAINPSPSREICSLRSKGPGILSRIQKDPASVAALISANHLLLEKYYEAISLPQFSEEGFPVEALPVQSNIVLAKHEASCLARMDLSLKLARNDTKAGQLLQSHLQYWLTSLTHSHSLISMMIANAQVQADLDWVSELSHQFPRQTSTALQAVTAQYAAFASMPRHDLWLQPFQGEFRFNLATTDAIRGQLQHDSALDRLQAFALSPLYQPHATLNQRQACLAQLVRGTEQPTSAASTSNWLYNPVGKSFDSCAYYEEYFSRVQITQTAAGRFVASLQHQP